MEQNWLELSWTAIVLKWVDSKLNSVGVEFAKYKDSDLRTSLISRPTDSIVSSALTYEGCSSCVSGVYRNTSGGQTSYGNEK